MEESHKVLVMFFLQSWYVFILVLHKDLLILNVKGTHCGPVDSMLDL